MPVIGARGHFSDTPLKRLPSPYLLLSVYIEFYIELLAYTVSDNTLGRGSGGIFSSNYSVWRLILNTFVLKIRIFSLIIGLNIFPLPTTPTSHDRFFIGPFMLAKARVHF